MDISSFAASASLALALHVAPVPAHAQEPAPRRLAAPLATFSHDVSAISGVRELADGRVLLSDFLTPGLYVVDLRRRSATPLGRQGSGPNEYLQPGGMYAGRGDTTYVLDRGQARLLLVTGDGRIAGTRSIRQQGTSGASDADIDRQRVDAAGLAYFEDPGAMFGALRRGRAADSVALLRFDPARQRSDTLARLKTLETRMTGAEGQFARMQRVLFSPADGWGVAADGRVAVVRAAPYRVDWIDADGRVTRGPDVRHDALPVTAADRAPSDERRQELGIANRGGSPVRTPGAGASAPIFADTKPPFAPDNIVVAPDGRVWVARHGPANAPTTVYDVFDRRGARVDRIALPPRSRVVGFGASAIYVSERDDDDLPRVRKYAL